MPGVLPGPQPPVLELDFPTSSTVQTSDLNSSQTASIFCHFNSSSSATLASSLAATANTAVSAALNSTLDAHQGGTLNLGCGIIFYTIRSPVRAWQALKLFAKQKRQRKQ